MQTQWSFSIYNPQMARQWDSFVDNARNATFLFKRAFVDHHSHIFSDFSIIALKNSHPAALLPANISGSTLHSHQGLTYGGWILPRKHINATDILDLWPHWLDFCRAQGISLISYKPLPHIYATMPSQDDIYALHRFGASPVECNVSAAIDLACNPGFNQMKRRQLAKASALDFSIELTASQQGYESFHNMLSQCLLERHGATPVHSLSQMLHLSSQFPDNIKLFTASVNGSMHAGVWMFISNRVAHCQYIASTPQGRDTNLLTALFNRLIEMAADGSFGPGIRYFDFGISNENHGLVLNSGLYNQKSALGASAVACHRYQFSI